MSKRKLRIRYRRYIAPTIYDLILYESIGTKERRVAEPPVTAGQLAKLNR